MGFGAIAVPLAITAASAVGSFLGSKKGSTVQQKPLRTGPQAESEQILLDFAKSGKFGDFEVGGKLKGFTPGAALEGFTPGAPLEGFTPGERFGGPLGDFDPTDIEGLGLGKLRGLLQGGLPESLSQAQQTAGAFQSGDRFDPFSETGEFAPFKATVEKNLAEAKDRLKQNAAFQGNLFSSDLVGQLGELEQEGQGQLTGKLAQLFSEFTGRKLDAARLGGDLGAAEEAISQGRIGTASSVGSLTRLLGGQESQAELTEFLRQRGELGTEAGRINAEKLADALRKRGELGTEAGRIRGEEKIPLDVLQGILGNQTQFGVPSVTTAGAPGPFDAVLQNLALQGSTALGEQLFRRKPTPVRPG